MSASLGSSSSQGTNAGANQSTVYASATVTITAGYFQGMQSYGYITIGDATYTIAGPTYMAALSDPHVAPESWSFSAQRTYDHDANGYRGAVGVSASFAVDGASFHNCGSDTADQGAIDYDRKPAVPAAPSAVVNSNKTITVNWSAVSSPAGTATYYIQYAAAVGGGGYGSWSSEVSTTSTTYTFSGLGRGATYKFHVRAANTDGNSGYGADSTGYFLPAGGKIYDAGTFRLTSFGRKLAADGVTWIDLTTGKKYDGTNWIDLS